MPNEQTSPEVKSYAGFILGMTKPKLAAYAASQEGYSAIRSIAASALTQAPPRKKFLGLF